MLDVINRYIHGYVAALLNSLKEIKQQVGKAKIKKYTTFSSCGNSVAVIGMACRFPGAENYQQFWNNLVNSINSITEVPQDRWNWQDYWGDPQEENNKTNSKWG